MHYYKRHLGDFSRDTAHLSQGQVGAFDLLLDWYYSNERPLPADKADVYRIGRAHSASERANVDKALSFFVLGPDGYRQKRADAELAQSAAQATTNRRIATERDARKRSRQQHESLNESLNESPHESCSDRVDFVVPSHKPVTIQEQKPEQQRPPAAPAAAKPKPPMPPLPDWVDPQAWEGFAAMRVRERHPLTPRAAVLVLAELAKLRGTGADPNAVLDQSTRNSWRDVYPIKQQPPRGAAAPSTSRTMAAIQALEDTAHAIHENNARLADGRDQDRPAIAALPFAGRAAVG